MKLNKPWPHEVCDCCGFTTTLKSPPLKISWSYSVGATRGVKNQLCAVSRPDGVSEWKLRLVAQTILGKTEVCTRVAGDKNEGLRCKPEILNTTSHILAQLLGEEFCGGEIIVV